MTTAIYKLKSAARPLQFISLADDNVVGHSDKPGVMIEWLVEFPGDGLATFRAVRDKQITNDCIAFDASTQSLIRSDNPGLFPVEKHPSYPDFNFIRIQGMDLAWALTAWEDNTPIQVQVKKDSTEQLWIFQEVLDE